MKLEVVGYTDGIMTSVSRILYDKNVELFKEAKNPLKSHGPDHHQRVYIKALGLAEKIGYEFDEQVLAAACLLHDLGAYYPETVGDAYHDHDAVYAEEVMREVGLPADKIELAVEAIENHGSDVKYKKIDESMETKLLRDADKLDVFGPLGCARIVMVRTLKGDSLEMIVDDFFTRGHLERKWQSISFVEARKMAKDDYEYSVDFFKKLAEVFSK